MRKRVLSAAAITAVGTVLAMSPPAHGQWVQDGVLLCNTPGVANVTASVPDGHGGTFVVFSDHDPISGFDVPRVQRIDANGFIATGWDPCGTGLTTLLTDISFYPPVAISDQAGGLYVAWYGELQGGLRRSYIQRVTAAGSIAPGWPADGRPVSSSQDERSPRLASDNSGGAFVAWYSASSSVRLLRIMSDGNCAAGWNCAGKAVTTTAGQSPDVVSDGQGGAIVTWTDFRNQAVTGADIYAQRIGTQGAVEWQANGVPLCTALGHQGSTMICTTGGGLLAVPDGSGGAIAVWPDGRDCNTTGADLYAQRVTANGAIASGWDSNGNPLCRAVREQPWSAQFDVIADGFSGAICAWVDMRNSDWDLYAQRIGASGDRPEGWLADGNLVCGVTARQLTPFLSSDGQGGAIESWTDYRAGATRIYASHVTEAGAIANDGPQDGVLVCAAGQLNSNGAIVSDDEGGALLAWSSQRAGNGSPVRPYAQRITPGGYPVSAVPSEVGPDLVGALLVYPTPASGSVMVEPRNLGPGRWSLQIFCAAGQLVRMLPTAGGESPTSSWVTWDETDESGRRVGPGVYFLRLEAPGVSHSARVLLVR